MPILYIGFSVLLLIAAWHSGADRTPASMHKPVVLTAPVFAVATRADNNKKNNIHSVETKTHPAAVIYRRLGQYVARRYQISSEMAIDIVAKAHAVGRKLKLDPLLILAVIAVESRFDPTAESARGAKGLMQVIPRWHADKLDSVGGEEMIFELEPNILVGARILKEYLLPTGELLDALQRYVGASSEEDATAYLEKIVRERDILSHVSGKPPGPAL